MQHLWLLLGAEADPRFCVKMPPKKRASLSRATDKNRNKAAAKVKAAASSPGQSKSDLFVLCDISMRVRVVLCVGWWLCFSACNLKKYCVVRCLVCLLVDIDTDVKIEEETE